MSKNNCVESCQPRRQAEELTELELCNITGGARAGKVKLNSISITKHFDKASPVLFL